MWLPSIKRKKDQPPELSPNLTYIYSLQIFLEHIICSPLMKHFENNNLLCEFQHGFRSNKFCDMQLISFFDDLTRNYDCGKQTDVILIDIAKAFNTVPHSRLKLKL